MRFRTNLRLKSGIIDPVPLIDVILQVTIFFLLAAQFIGRPGVVLELPSVRATALYRDSAVRVTVTGGKLFFQGKEIGMGQLQEELGKGLTSVLVIEAEKDVPHAMVVEIIELARRMGISEIAIAAEEER